MCSTSSTSSASAAGPRSRRGCSPASPGSRRPPAQNISTGPTYRYRRIRPGIGRTLCGVTTTSTTATERRRLTAIRAAWLFEGTSTTLMPDPTVVLDGTPIVAGIRTAVRERAERGVDIIKIMASGGNLTPGSRPELPQYGPAELRAAVDEAHRHNLAITAHAHATQAIIDAIGAGMDGLEHVTFM